MMKHIKFTALAIFISLMLLNTKIITCEAKSEANMMQSHANYFDKSSKNDEDPDFQDDQDRRFRVLFSIIKQDLIEKYNNLDAHDVEEDYMILFKSYGKID